MGTRQRAFVGEVAHHEKGKILGEQVSRGLPGGPHDGHLLGLGDFIILFTLWWAPSLSLFQNIVILIASFVAAATVGAGRYAMLHGWEL